MTKDGRKESRSAAATCPLPPSVRTSAHRAVTTSQPIARPIDRRADDGETDNVFAGDVCEGRGRCGGRRARNWAALKVACVGRRARAGRARLAGSRFSTSSVKSVARPSPKVDSRQRCQRGCPHQKVEVAPCGVNQFYGMHPRMHIIFETEEQLALCRDSLVHDIDAFFPVGVYVLLFQTVVEPVCNFAIFSCLRKSGNKR